MTGFAAAMEPAFQLSAADLATGYVGKPTWLILKFVAAAEAWFRRQERTFRAMLVVEVTVVWDLRMAAVFVAFALESAWWRPCATRQRRLEHGSSAVAGNFVEDCLAAAVARTFVAKLRTSVIPAFEWSIANSSANMLGLKVVVESQGCFMEWSAFSLRSLTFGCLLLARTAMLTALMATTIEFDSAHSRAFRWFDRILVADGS